MDINKLERIIADQNKLFCSKGSGIQRNIDFKKYLDTKQITVISGIRRCGKSTLLKQFSNLFSSFYYINFDDERLISFTVEDFDNLMIAFKKVSDNNVIFLDEIQNIIGWERFVRRIFEEGYKIFLTGSNAKLLSSEIGTHLTGRYFKIELYPFSFLEFLEFKKIDWKQKDTSTKANILTYLNIYLKNGGFPDFIQYEDIEFVTKNYEDIMYRDILTRYNIREVKAFKELSAYLFTNITKEISYNSLKNILGFKSVSSVKNYIEYLKESYLVFDIYKYDYSLKKQFVSNKKIYVIDNGMRNSIAFSFSEDYGQLLENLVFIELQRRRKETFYYKGKNECDFLVKEGNKICQCIQVTRSFSEKNNPRELNGLFEAMERFNLKQGIILTEDKEENIVIDNKKIILLPVYKWLLNL